MGSNLRRFTRHRVHGSPYELDRLHPAILGARSLFRARVAFPGTDRLLKRGAHNRKIGDRIVKGRWAGMPIFTLTLEERATCPETCAHWLDCYGNKMNWSTRWRHGPEFEHILNDELHTLADENPSGFVVRLHVLGDFYSEGYLRRWAAWLNGIPQLHVFGYSAHAPDSKLGAVIAKIIDANENRFAIRFSDRIIDRPSTISIYENARGRLPIGIVCPAQTGDTDCCATCGLCWQTKERIVFLAH